MVSLLCLIFDLKVHANPNESNPAVQNESANPQSNLYNKSSLKITKAPASKLSKDIDSQNYLKALRRRAHTASRRAADSHEQLDADSEIESRKSSPNYEKLQQLQLRAQKERLEAANQNRAVANTADQSGDNLQAKEYHAYADMHEDLGKLAQKKAEKFRMRRLRSAKMSPMQLKVLDYRKNRGQKSDISSTTDESSQSSMNQ